MKKFLPIVPSFICVQRFLFTSFCVLFLFCNLNAQWVVDSTVEDVTCNGGNDGCVTVEPSGGCHPLSFSWTNGVSTWITGDPWWITGDTETNQCELLAGNYVVTVSDDCGVQVEHSFTISEPERLTFEVITTSPPTCPGSTIGADGTAMVSIQGGTPPYRAGWLSQDSDFVTGEIQNNLFEGTYLVTVFDASECWTHQFVPIYSECNDQEICNEVSFLVQDYCEGSSSFFDFEYDFVGEPNSIEVSIGNAYMESFTVLDGKNHTVLNDFTQGETVVKLAVHYEDYSCFAFADLALPNCEQDCSIDIVATAGVCGNGQYNVELNIESLNLPANTGNLSIAVMGAGHNYYSAPYNGAESILVGPVGNAVELNEIEVNIYDENFKLVCQGTTDFDKPDCPYTSPCNISLFEYEFECTDDGLFVDFTLEVEGDPGPIFTYRLGQEDVMLNYNPSNTYSIAIPEGADEFGFISFAPFGTNLFCGFPFFLPNCKYADGCNATLSANALCDKDEYFVDLALTVTDLPGNLFGWEYEIVGNDKTYVSDFFVGSVAHKFGPFTNSQEVTEFNLIVYDPHGDVACQDVVSFTAPNCDDSVECEISNLVGEVICEDGRVSLNFDFDEIGFQSPFFKWQLGGITGIAALTDQATVLNGLLPGEYALVVSEYGNDGCSATIQVTVPVCNEIEEFCSIQLEASRLCFSGGNKVKLVYTLDDLTSNLIGWRYSILGNGKTYVDKEPFYGSGERGLWLEVNDDVNEFSIEVYNFDGEIECSADALYNSSSCMEIEDCGFSIAIAEVYGSGCLLKEEFPWLEGDLLALELYIPSIPEGSTQYGISSGGVELGVWDYEFPGNFDVFVDFPTGGQTGDEITFYDILIGPECSTSAEVKYEPTCDENFLGEISVAECQENFVYLQINGREFEERGDYTWSIEPSIASYTPDPFDAFGFGWEVPFTGECQVWEVVLTNNVDPSKSYAETITVCPCGDGVWPGDTNIDGVADNADFLNIGLAYGNLGTPRAVESITWFSMFGIEWVQHFGTGVNFQHADCNGDGLINYLDTEAIDLNYGSTHGKTDGQQGVEGEAPLYVDFPDEALSPGQEVEFPIVFGTAEYVVPSVYGIAFNINYSGTLIENPSIKFNDSWLGTEYLDALKYVKHFPDEQRFEIAFSRIDKVGIGGFGRIGALHGILVENVEAYHEAHKELSAPIDGVRIIDYNEEEVEFSILEERGILASGEKDLFNTGMKLYPNLVNDHFTLSSQDGALPTSLRCIDISGKVVFTQELDQSLVQRVDLPEMKVGVYFIEISNEEGRGVRKIQVIR